MTHIPPILHGVRILSLALNLPGPAALMRCQQMGASCTKLEPVTATGGPGDPMAGYCAEAYDAMRTNNGFQQGMDEKAALAELDQNAGTQFDPEIVRLLAEKVLR